MVAEEFKGHLLSTCISLARIYFSKGTVFYYATGRSGGPGRGAGEGVKRWGNRKWETLTMPAGAEANINTVGPVITKPVL